MKEKNFDDINELIDCLKRGCEVEFLYGGKMYSITHTEFGISITEFYNEESERTYGSVQDALEYQFGTKSLKDIIFEMDVIERSF